MKQTLRFDQISCRLQVEGVPDVSTGQGNNAIGIITGWNLQWAGRPELEGKKEHLLALIQTVLPYARRLISDAAAPIGNTTDPVELQHAGAGSHRLLLRSSQPDTPPLEVQLDDAELADLVRVLDRLRLDPRLQVDLPVPPVRPLRAREVQERTPLPRRLAGVVGGAAALALAAASAWLLPPPPAPQPVASPTPAAAGGAPVPPP
jgi:hypothetical protein